MSELKLRTKHHKFRTKHQELRTKKSGTVSFRFWNGAFQIQERICVKKKEEAEGGEEVAAEEEEVA